VLVVYYSLGLRTCGDNINMKQTADIQLMTWIKTSMGSTLAMVPEAHSPMQRS
jgi:hypothetical protein